MKKWRNTEFPGTKNEPLGKKTFFLESFKK
jgi:hypothetical protein